MANLRVRHDTHQIPHWDTEKRPLSQLHLSFSFFPSSIGISGAERASVSNCWMVEAKKNFPCSEEKEQAKLKEAVTRLI